MSTYSEDASSQNGRNVWCFKYAKLDVVVVSVAKELIVHSHFCMCKDDHRSHSFGVTYSLFHNIRW